jgi:hypothetical protein
MFTRVNPAIGGKPAMLPGGSQPRTRRSLQRAERRQEPCGHSEAAAALFVDQGGHGGPDARRFGGHVSPKCWESPGLEVTDSCGKHGKL